MRGGFFLSAQSSRCSQANKLADTEVLQAVLAQTAQTAEHAISVKYQAAVVD